MCELIGFPLSPVPLAATAAPPTLAMQPHMVVQAADGTTHLVPAPVSIEVYRNTKIMTQVVTVPKTP